MVAQLDRDYGRYGLARSLRRFASYGLFEGRPATTRGQWFNPAVFAWLRTLDNLGDAPPVQRPLYIVGLGRSGTTILGVLLSLHRDVGFLNEPKSMWHVVDPRQDINGNYGCPEPRFRLGADDAREDIAQRARRIFGRYLQVVRARRLVDKYPELIFRLPYVQRIFPDARFVFIHRSGVDACESIVSWSKRLARGGNGSREDWWGRNDCKWLHLWNELLMGDQNNGYGELHGLDPLAVDHANRAALEWIVTMREGLAACERHGPAVLRLRYESLIKQPREQISGVLDFCGLDHDDAVFGYAARRLYDNPSKTQLLLLPPVQRWFDETMAALGY